MEYDTYVSSTDTTESPSLGPRGERPDAIAPWLVLTHQLPPDPPYVRVKVRRRLHKIGALPLKNSVYLLPATAESLEDFEWLRRLIVDEGGEATLMTAKFVGGLTDDEIRQMFVRSRDAMYLDIAAAARGAMKGGSSEAELARLKKQLSEVVAMDFFHAANRGAAEHAVQKLENKIRPEPPAQAAAGGGVEKASFEGRTWVTRAHVRVDRLACIWFIRRFVDADARFKFVAPEGYVPQPGELRFDMFEGEFTHAGDKCSFEVMMDRFQPDDPRLAAVGEVVHDIDCKDGKHGRPEVAGVASAIRGITTDANDDATRIPLGMGLFDALYAGLEPAR